MEILGDKAEFQAAISRPWIAKWFMPGRRYLQVDYSLKGVMIASKTLIYKRGKPVEEHLIVYKEAGL